MSDNRQVASTLMAKAHQAVIKDRPGVHGSAQMSFQMIAEMWTVYMRHATIARDGDSKITAVDVLQMMSLLKKARAIFGDVTNDDNFIDDLGYTALAGMLQLPDPAKMPKPDEHEHLFPDEEHANKDGDGWSVSCMVDGCTVKKQVRKSKQAKADA